MRGRGVLRRVVGALASWVVVLGLVRAVVALPEHCPAVTVDELRHASQEAVDWLGRNQAPDGRWLYRYDRDRGESLGGYNTVRHAGVVMSLYQAHAADIDGALVAADRGLDYALDNLVRHDDWLAFEPSSARVTTGAAALLVAGLVERRLVTGDTRYDDAMAGFGRFLVTHVEPSGAVIESWNRTTGEPAHGEYSPFFTGEVYWALALLHLVDPDGEWGEVAHRIGTYIATERDEVEGYFPDLPDHWAAYGLSTEIRWSDAAGGTTRLGQERVDYVQRQAGLGSVQARWESQRVDAAPRYLLRGRRTLGAGLGTVGEQLTGLWQVSVADERLAHLSDAIGERAQCVAGMLVERQVGAPEADDSPEPDRARGAWFQFGITQMDDQQHALSALLLTIPILEHDSEASP